VPSGADYDASVVAAADARPLDLNPEVRFDAGQKPKIRGRSFRKRRVGVAFEGYYWMVWTTLAGIHRPVPADERQVAEVLLSQEGRELRIGPRVRPRG
jgi:hypothetical protein